MAKNWIMILLGAGMLVLKNGDALAEQKCDTSKPETTPTSRFIVNKQEGTAFDTKTQLTWKICEEGKNYREGKCIGKRTKFSWADAMETLGKSGEGWRLPNKDELMSIVEKRCYSPTINLSVFPDAELGNFWSASTYVPNPARAWNVSFSAGGYSALNKAYDDSARLVRGGQWFDPFGDLAQEHTEEKSKKTLAEINQGKGKQQFDQRADVFRKNLKTGDDSSCGLVIEVKRPIAKIQTASGERWLKIEQLYPQGSQTCGQVAGDTRFASADFNLLIGSRVCKVFTGIRDRISGEGFCGSLANNIERRYVTCSGRIAVTGVVENVAGKKIQIRVSNVHVAENPKYYAPFESIEGFIDRNSVIWDQAANWSGC